MDLTNRNQLCRGFDWFMWSTGRVTTNINLFFHYKKENRATLVLGNKLLVEIYQSSYTDQESANSIESWVVIVSSCKANTINPLTLCVSDMLRITKVLGNVARQNYWFCLVQGFEIKKVCLYYIICKLHFQKNKRT